MPGKPFHSILIPYEDEILSLRKQHPPVAFARIAELLKDKHQVSIQRAAICARDGKSRKPERTNTLPGPGTRRRLVVLNPTAPRLDRTLHPNVTPAENRRPWSDWQEKAASRGKMLTTFTPSNEYNLTRLSPEEAAAYIEQLKREREKNGG